MRWKHPCVQWGNDNETSQWAHIEAISVPPDQVWLPIIQHTNAVGDLYGISEYVNCCLVFFIQFYTARTTLNIAWGRKTR